MPETLHIVGTISFSVAGVSALMLTGISLQRVAAALLAAGTSALALGHLMNDPVGLHTYYVPDSSFSWLGARFGALIGFSSVVVLTWLPPVSTDSSE
ncbi:MAG: hypothetical protein M3O70_14860 [Actinomycetota bacterium]|nr:hypothetical protein [Actinomycetota bacterium]